MKRQAHMQYEKRQAKGVLGAMDRERLRKFKILNLEGYKKFDLPFLPI